MNWGIEAFHPAKNVIVAQLPEAALHILQQGWARLRTDARSPSGTDLLFSERYLGETTRVMEVKRVIVPTSMKWYIHSFLLQACGPEGDPAFASTPYLRLYEHASCPWIVESVPLAQRFFLVLNAPPPKSYCHLEIALAEVVAAYKEKGDTGVLQVELRAGRMVIYPSSRPHRLRTKGTSGSENQELVMAEGYVW